MATQSEASSADRDALALAWALGRTPLLLILLFLFRTPLLTAIEHVFDIIWITEFTISVASTPASRLLIAIAAAALFFLAGKAGEKYLGGWRGYAAALAASLIVALAIAMATQSGKKALALTLGLLATNWAALELWTRAKIKPDWLRKIVIFPPAIGEALLASRYLGWLKALWRKHEFQLAETPAKAPGAVIAALALALFLNGHGLAPMERALRSGDEITRIAEGDFNGLALDASGRYLFVTGHGTANLLRFDTEDLSAEPVESDVETGYAQGLAYDPARNEVYLFNTGTREVLAFNGETMKLARAIPAPDLAPGDPWIAIDPISNTLALVSEADEQTGAAILVFDRDSGEVVDRRSEEAGNLIMHPSKPILYLSFFRRERGVLAYDMATHEIVARGPTDARMERLTFDTDADEVLVTSPVEGEVLRFDAESLEQKGRFAAIFGVRVLTIDSTRQILLAGSLATGQIASLDLPGHERSRTWYVGPWLRSIEIAPDRGVAYVSSQGALYEFRYASPER